MENPSAIKDFSDSKVPAGTLDCWWIKQIRSGILQISVAGLIASGALLMQAIYARTAKYMKNGFCDLDVSEKPIVSAIYPRKRRMRFWYSCNYMGNESQPESHLLRPRNLSVPEIDALIILSRESPRTLIRSIAIPAFLRDSAPRQLWWSILGD